MRIGLMGAIEEEVAFVRAELASPRSESSGGRRYDVGRLHGCDVVLAFSRMGKVAASATAATLIGRYGVDAVVFSGVAGGASADLNIGDIVVGRELVQHDLDARPLFPRFEVPLLGVSRFRAPAAWQRAAARAAREFARDDLGAAIGPAAAGAFGIGRPTVHEGLIASGDQFIDSALELRAIRRALPGLLCVEMEGAAVAQVCYEHRVPWVVIRAISDRADHAAPVDYPRFIREVASHYAPGILRRLLPRCRAPGGRALSSKV